MTQQPVAYGARCDKTGKWGYIWHERADVEGWIEMEEKIRPPATFTLVPLEPWDESREINCGAVEKRLASMDSGFFTRGGHSIHDLVVAVIESAFSD